MWRISPLLGTWQGSPCPNTSALPPDSKEHLREFSESTSPHFQPSCHGNVWLSHSHSKQVHKSSWLSTWHIDTPKLCKAFFFFFNFSYHLFIHIQIPHDNCAEQSSVIIFILQTRKQTEGSGSANTLKRCRAELVLELKHVINTMLLVSLWLTVVKKTQG